MMVYDFMVVLSGPCVLPTSSLEGRHHWRPTHALERQNCETRRARAFVAREPLNLLVLCGEHIGKGVSLVCILSPAFPAALRQCCDTRDKNGAVGCW